jgi:hypothetical protein
MLRKKERKTDPAILRAMKRYLKSEKGRTTRQAYLKRNARKVEKYIENYMKSARQKAKENGICIHCFRNRPNVGYVQCSDCLRKQRAYHWKRRRGLLLRYKGR